MILYANLTLVQKDALLAFQMFALRVRKIIIFLSQLAHLAKLAHTHQQDQLLAQNVIRNVNRVLPLQFAQSAQMLQNMYLLEENAYALHHSANLTVSHPQMVAQTSATHISIILTLIHVIHAAFRPFQEALKHLCIIYARESFLLKDGRHYLGLDIQEKETQKMISVQR